MGAQQIETMKFERRDIGRADTLRFNIMMYINEGNYDRAIFGLKEFLDAKFEFPNFKDKIERYLLHCVDLVNAIKAKKNFPGKHLLPSAKQQEINIKYAQHYRELDVTLKKIERIQVKARVEDVKSTIWVVKAVMNAVFAVALMAFIIDMSTGLFHSALIVIDDAFIKLTEFIFQYVGF